MNIVKCGAVLYSEPTTLSDIVERQLRFGSAWILYAIRMNGQQRWYYVGSGGIFGWTLATTFEVWIPSAVEGKEPKETEYTLKVAELHAESFRANR